MTKEEMLAEYRKANAEGRKHLAEANQQKDYTKAAIATIKLNACTHIKNHMQLKIGEQWIKEQDD